MEPVRLTPAMIQYTENKKLYPDCIILFRMGDFYETFSDDAVVVARDLDITLTARGKGETRTPLAGIPYHALEPYLAKLVKAGHKVAICEQLEDPKKAKGIVKRGVVRVVTPGTIIESTMLDAKSNNYIMSLYTKMDSFGIAVVDMSTGEFIATEVDNEQKLLNELTRYQPSECIIPYSLQVNNELIKMIPTVVHSIDDVYYAKQYASETLLKHFKTLSLDGYGIGNKPLLICAAGALISYLNDTQKRSLDHISSLRCHESEQFMIIDASTQRNLELIKNIIDGNLKGSLLSVMDKTKTAMGSRLLRKYLLMPLIDKTEIESRHDAVEEMVTNPLFHAELVDGMKNINDIERLIGRVAYGNADAKDLLALMISLKTVPSLKKFLGDSKAVILKKLADMPDCKEVVSLIFCAIKSEPNTSLREGNLIKEGYNESLDQLRSIVLSGKSFIADIETQERERTGIKNLRVGYNRVFGYYIIVTKSQLHLVPKEYIRKQTLANEERYITPQIKEKEELILHAEEKINEMEYTLFNEIISKVASHITIIQSTAFVLSTLDVLQSFALVALSNNYIRPNIDKNNIILLKGCRHPVVECLVDNYVPNDFCIDKSARFQLITGPNMSGKSTALRQVALIQLMAQMGSYVPASQARLGVADRIFSRVGAYDDLSHGQSTFMIEMTETANILNNATERSLVILDEIGRGTSTFDGIALAWAIAEHIHQTIKAKTLFATHYHQLNTMEDRYEGIKNFNIAVSENASDIIFLRKIVAGGTDKSYGIHVAKLAGLPKEVIKRSQIFMNQLELSEISIPKPESSNIDDNSTQAHDILTTGTNQNNKDKDYVKQKTLDF